MREMMEEINYWRMVAKHPGEVDRPRGGQAYGERYGLKATEGWLIKLIDRF